MYVILCKLGFYTEPISTLYNSTEILFRGDFWLTVASLKVYCCSAMSSLGTLHIQNVHTGFVYGITTKFAFQLQTSSCEIVLSCILLSYGLLMAGLMDSCVMKHYKITIHICCEASMDTLCYTCILYVHSLCMHTH